MSTGFADTTRALERQRLSWVGLVPWLLLVAGWCAWLCRARVNVYASTPRARVEVTQRPSRITTERAGRVRRLDYALGAHVEAGAVLVELDTALEQAQLARTEGELESLKGRLAALSGQIAVEQARRSSRVRMDDLARARADVGLEQARATALRKQEVAQITEGLAEAQLSSRIEQLNAEGDLRSSQIEVDGASVEVERLQAVHDYEDKSHLARIAELERQRRDVESERAVKTAEVLTARVSIERARIVAPVAGKLGSVAPYQVGDVVQAGDVLATLVPDDGVHVVAEFEPSSAVGRIMPGQPARIRFEAFSWTQFGAADITVRHVASEPHDGLIRVELQLAPDPGLRVPVQHGLPGTVDVQVESVTPFELCLRSVGTTLAGSAAPDNRLASAGEAAR